MQYEHQVQPNSQQMTKWGNIRRLVLSLRSSSCRLECRRAIMGDNLSSHMKIDVLNLYVENTNIDFICLVPNTINFCSTFSKWKLQNLRLFRFHKETFVKLLKNCMAAIIGTLIKSYCASGIYFEFCIYDIFMFNGF